MYQAQTAGILETIMNALSLPTSRKSATPRRIRILPRRRETAVAPSIRDRMPEKETYFEAARLSRWNR